MRRRETQRDRILRLLKEREGAWVPVFEVAALACQYGARIKELRDAGYLIENKIEHRNGAVYSWFRLKQPKGQRYLFGLALERPCVQV